MAAHRLCNAVAEIDPGRFEKFRAGLAPDLTFTTTAESSGLLCELVRTHEDSHATCAGFVKSGEELFQEVWAIWPPDTIGGAPDLWQIPVCVRTEDCIFFSGHGGGCSTGVSE